jgi:hypothetical protein
MWSRIRRKAEYTTVNLTLAGYCKSMLILKIVAHKQDAKKQK